jgi:7-carboxy-7-deazaguanine synthase (Cx14CxxC type)
MTYSVKEIFYTLQGEGAQAGRPAVFCRFAGCNLWTGREADRAAAVCNFCDTDFVGTDGSGGGKFNNAEALAAAILANWPQKSGKPFVVCTGGEPLLQLDPPLIDALHGLGFEIAVETNGTLAAPKGIDWICVSPKAGAKLAQTSGNELKLVYPQAEARPGRFEMMAFDNFFLQPMDGLGINALEQRQRNTAAALAYCLKHPKWRLGLQSHKILGIR